VRVSRLRPSSSERKSEKGERARLARRGPLFPCCSGETFPSSACESRAGSRKEDEVRSRCVMLWRVIGAARERIGEAHLTVVMICNCSL
jgi:hypothetical protein